MLDVTHSQVDVETEFSLVAPILIFLQILASIKWSLAFGKYYRRRKVVNCFCPTF